MGISSTAPAPQPRGGHVADEKVLILDFGSQYAQLHCPPRPRAARLLRDRPPLRSPPSASPELRPRGLILSGGPDQRLRAGRFRCDPRAVQAGNSGPRHLLRHAARLRRAGGQSATAPRPASTAGPKCEITSARRPVCRRAKPDRSLDEPRRPGHERPAAEFVPLARTSTCPIAAVKHASAADLWPAVPPRGDAHARGRQILANFLTEICRCNGTWRLGDFAEQAIAQRPGAGRAATG